MSTMHQPRTPKARETQHFDFSNLHVRADLESYYWVDDQQFANAFGSTLPSKLADLIDLAMTVYYADRRSVRVRSSYIQSGQRNFDIRLPMRDLQLWSRDDIAEKLTDLLHWYTEDRWPFTFTPRQASLHSSEADQYLFPLPVKQPAVTVLFSGGLDSLAGLVAQLDLRWLPPQNSRSTTMWALYVVFTATSCSPCFRSRIHRFGQILPARCEIYA